MPEGETYTVVYCQPEQRERWRKMRRLREWEENKMWAARIRERMKKRKEAKASTTRPSEADGDAAAVPPALGYYLPGSHVSQGPRVPTVCRVTR